MPTTCEIYFNNNKNCNFFNSGQKIMVAVRLTFTEEIKFRSITINFRGKTSVHFMKDDRKMEGKYIAHENVSDMNKCLEDSNHVFFIFLYSSTQPHSKRRVGVASFLPPYRNFQCFKAFVSFKIGGNTTQNSWNIRI